MGFFSKEPVSHQKGDQQVNVATSLENHIDYHLGHSVKLWVLIAIMVCAVLYWLYNQFRKNIKGQAIRAARSAATVATLEAV